MTYSIIGLGGIGSAIARAFAAKGIEVTVAGRRSPEELAPLAAQIGPSVIPRSIREAVQADIVILAVPFAAHRDVARASADWSGKIVIDAMNAFGVPPEDLDGLPSTTAVARAFTGAKLVKAFNHLPTATLAQGPTAQGGRRVVFVSGDDDTASATVSGLVDRLGFAPVELGKVAEGGMLVQARGRTWGRLIFQDLVKFG